MYLASRFSLLPIAQIAKSVNVCPFPVTSNGRMYRKQEKPYHIDYCFVSADLLDKVTKVEIGTYENWTAHSDHSPINIDIDL